MNPYFFRQFPNSFIFLQICLVYLLPNIFISYIVTKVAIVWCKWCPECKAGKVELIIFWANFSLDNIKPCCGPGIVLQVDVVIISTPESNGLGYSPPTINPDICDASNWTIVLFSCATLHISSISNFFKITEPPKINNLGLCSFINCIVFSLSIIFICFSIIGIGITFNLKTFFGVDPDILIWPPSLIAGAIIVSPGSVNAV